MWPFSKKIITKRRKHALDNFRKKAFLAVKELEKNTKNETLKHVYSRFADSIANTPILFYPRHTLRTTVYNIGGRLGMSVVRGEHVNSIKVVQKGRERFLIKSDYINLPAEHIFNGDELSIQGIFTLCHEYGHFPKPGLLEFAQSLGLNLEQAEELTADILAAKVAVKLGYPKENVLGHFRGREVVYGDKPFQEYILKSVS